MQTRAHVWHELDATLSRLAKLIHTLVEPCRGPAFTESQTHHAGSVPMQRDRGGGFNLGSTQTDPQKRSGTTWCHWNTPLGTTCGLYRDHPGTSQLCQLRFRQLRRSTILGTFEGGQARMCEREGINGGWKVSQIRLLYRDS